MTRSIHFLDLEYLGLGPTVTAADLDLVLTVYRRHACVESDDLLIGAASTWVYKRIAFDFSKGVRPLNAGAGPDAADRRLIDEAMHTDLRHLDCVTIGSGDHLFTAIAFAADDAGVSTRVVAYGFNLSRELRRSVDRVIDLAQTWGTAA